MTDKMQIGIKNNSYIQRPCVEPAKTFNSKDLSFRAVLDEQLQSQKTELQMSKHAKERIAQRGIDFNEDLVNALNSAAETARLKGAKDIVMIGKEAAFVVNLPNSVIVTAVSSAEMKDNVFTNIDSAVLI